MWNGNTVHSKTSSWVVIAAVLLSFGCLNPTFGDTGDPDELLSEGTSLLRSNKCDEAIVKFKSACDARPDYADAHHQWGIALMKLGRAQDAIDQLKQATSLNPQSAASLLSLGGAYQEAGDVPDAVSTYSNFVDRFPQDREIAKIRKLLAILQREGGSNGDGSPDSNGTAPPSASAPIRITQPDADDSKPEASADDYFDAVTRKGVMRWTSKQIPLRVWISDGYDVSGFRPIFAAILKEAFLDWSNASNGALTVSFVDKSDRANVLCRWGSDPLKFKNSAESGETKLFADSEGLVRGEMEILTLSASPELQMTDNRMRSVALHEVGHMLGLGGHTTNPNDVMFYSASSSDAWRTLTSRDKNTLARLYQLK